MAFSKKNHNFIHPVYKLNKLPKIVSDSFAYGDRIGYCGSIFKRSIQGPLGVIYKHYAFFYGIDEKGVIWLIERNGDGVICISLDDFKIGNPVYQVEYLETDPKKREDIIERAKQEESKTYRGDIENCEHFVNFSVFEEHESDQAEITKAFANVTLSIYEAMVMTRMDPKSFKVMLDATNNIRKAAGLERDKRMKKIIALKKKQDEQKLNEGKI